MSQWNTILQLSTHRPTPTVSSQTPHPENLEILLIYYISLSWLFTILFHVATNVAEYIVIDVDHN